MAHEPLITAKEDYLRKPSWLKRKIPGGAEYVKLKKKLIEKSLNTVCESASCPNLAECWSRGTATFMILGNICTRGCRFCDVPKGKPGNYDRGEPKRVAESVLHTGIKFAVITSVNRDELPDQGAEVWVDTIREIRKSSPSCYIETLIPDLQGNKNLLDIILNANPDILNHNFETVKRLQQEVRGRGNIKDTSFVLKHSKSRGFVTKTSFMLGLGETKSEVEEMILHCAQLGVDIVTFGQYLQPSKKHLKVECYVTPEEFKYFQNFSLENGIKICESGPMVRSSYKAERSIPLIEQTKIFKTN